MSKPSLRVLWVFPSFARNSHGLNAPLRRFVELAPRLGADYEHKICALDQNYSAADELPEGFAWTKLDLNLRSSGRVSLRNMWTIRKVLSAERPNLLVTSNWPSLDWLMVNRGPGAIPHVHFEDPNGTEEAEDRAEGAQGWGRRRAFPGRDRAFVAPSGEIARAFVESWGAPEASVHRLPPGVDPERFARIERRLGGDKVVFGAVAPMMAAKRQDRLLRLVKSLRERGRDAHALIIGDGPEKARLKEQVKELGLTAVVSYGEQLDLEAALARMDVFAITSDAERVSPSLPVAMAAGLPVISTAVSDIRENVAAENALFVRPVADESALTAAAELLASDAQLRLDIGRANRAKAAELYDYEALARQLDTVFRRVGASWRLLLPAPEATPAAAPLSSDAASEPGDGRNGKAGGDGGAGAASTTNGALVPAKPAAAPEAAKRPEPAARPEPQSAGDAAPTPTKRVSKAAAPRGAARLEPKIGAETAPMLAKRVSKTAATRGAARPEPELSAETAPAKRAAKAATTRGGARRGGLAPA